MTLEEALRELQSEYELDERLERDTLRELKIRAKLELVRDLLDKLASLQSGEEQSK